MIRIRNYTKKLSANKKTIFAKKSIENLQNILKTARIGFLKC
ncbi:hypothetical protein LEP1GSC021_0473 [Leptospira noguchii str. 1993005606]|uniref:Uncharacterized protein n=3 Tax=Leptospira noguchii TaxID=28182 RepID=M6YDB6_9LEPT|nr:hypothetical protein LEP1GSC035_1063 [Leptospira noguchii str. 2007001578]EMO87619.1 hypothetical protein LEP1GSC024_3472 [Leptospira noguchii str. 2001034031]EPE86315.1 hypothetical protein LEP1GSC021_0473 [Leptospira noguchii str. 1993005606]EQA72365.1 hypothetical protein LEP1GSC059_3724 [Leptospira noguchii serovar Panama str. CZ214]